MKTVFPIAVFILVLLSSCGINVQKRLYRDGFYVNTSCNKPDRQSRTFAEQKTIETICLDMAPENVDAIPKCLPEKYPIQTVQQHNLTEQSAAENLPAAETGKTEREVITVAETTEGGMSAIEKLNRNATAFLKASILVFPLAFLTLSIALTLSLFALSKIRRLTRQGNVPAEQEKKLHQQRKRARKTAWISGAILMLLLISFIIFFCVSGPLINAGNIPIGL